MRSGGRVMRDKIAGIGIHLHDKFLDALIVRVGRQRSVSLIIFKPLFIVVDEVEKLLIIGAVRLLEFTATNLQEKIAVMLTTGVDFTFFENIKAHEVEPDEVHSVLIEMHVVFFRVALAKLCVLTDDRAEIGIHLLEAAQRIMLEITVDEDFGIHSFRDAFIDIETHRIAGNILMLKAEILKYRFAGAENMLFLFILRIVVMRQSVLQTAELLIGIAAKGM